MEQFQANPYQSGGLSDTPTRPQHRWLDRFAVGACVYYIVSAITLPFARTFWVSEIPIFAILQLPKSILKSVVHDHLLRAVHFFGWSMGSASPDFRMIHPWAMTLMLSIPGLLLLIVIFCFRSGRMRTALMIALVTCGSIDAVVTLWFDASSSLKIYNASYF